MHVDDAIKKIEAVSRLLEEHGCDCDCGCDSDGHSEDCVPCFACQIAQVLEAPVAPVAEDLKLTGPQIQLLRKIAMLHRSGLHIAIDDPDQHVLLKHKLIACAIDLGRDVRHPAWSLCGITEAGETWLASRDREKPR